MRQDETQESPSNLRRVSAAEIKQVRGSVEREGEYVYERRRERGRYV